MGSKDVAQACLDDSLRHLGSVNWRTFQGLWASHWVQIARKGPLFINGRGAESLELRHLDLA